MATACDRSLNLLVLWRRSRALDELRHFRSVELRGAVAAEGLGTVSLDDACAAMANTSASAATFSSGRDAAQFATPRCVLVAAVIQIIGLGSCVEESVGSVAESNGLRRSRVQVNGVSAKKAAKVREQLQTFGVGCDDPDFEQAVLWYTEHDGLVKLGWEVASGNAKTTKSVLKHRVGQAPTSMASEEAVLTANLAAIPAGGTVFDPCTGAGALLQAAVVVTGGLAFGADIDAEALRVATANFSAAKLPPPCLIQADATVPPWQFQVQTFDAVVCDVPYGVRAAVGVSNQIGGEWLDVFKGVIQLASQSLAGGGRLAVWVPDDGCSLNGGDEDELAARLASVCRQDGGSLELQTVLREDRRGGVQRALAIIQNTSSFAPRSKPSLDRLVRKAEAHASARDANARTHARLNRGVSYAQAKRQRDESSTADVWRAAWVGDAETVQSYLRDGGVVDAVDPGGNRTLLQLASGYGRLGVIRVLLEARADAGFVHGDCAVHRAARFGHLEVLAALLHHPRATSSMAEPDADGMTAANLAARWGHPECLELLLKSATKEVKPQLLSTLGAEGLAPLHGAARYGRESTLRVLLEHTADPRQRSEDGAMAVHLAARWGHLEVLKVLLELDPDSVCLHGASGRTPFAEAEVWSRNTCVDFLRQHGSESCVHGTSVQK